MNNFVLWENTDFSIITLENPHIPYEEGPHVLISPKRDDVADAWQDVDLAQSAFKLAAQTCKIMEKLYLAPWFNIQANGNWGLLPGSEPHFHVHVLGRKRTANWGKPVVLPETPNTYQNEPMPKIDRERLSIELKKQLR